MQDALQSVAGAIAFGGVKSRIFRLRLDAGALEQRTQACAAPYGIADQASADGIRNAFKRERRLVRRLAANFVVAEAQGMINQAVDGERPFLGIDRGFAVGGHQIEIVAGSNGAERGFGPVVQIGAHIGIAGVHASHHVTVDGEGQQHANSRARRHGEKSAPVHRSKDLLPILILSRSARGLESGRPAAPFLTAGPTAANYL